VAKFHIQGKELAAPDVFAQPSDVRQGVEALELPINRTLKELASAPGM
jgi:hypothetical protein